ncbi:protein NATD1 isoform X2 [Polyodon spathula]|uniref:protein NATD1 isoform X2 n=1 Tax=Polyodon spathula TaxID=7913 RepID=UPI001B7F65F2|nr:protein NATD1 isoform X2 [Polyodon spathula]
MELNCPIKVEHDRKRRQFTVRLNGSHDHAVLLYEYIGKKTVDLQHTEVPDAYRGRGIAKHLAKEVAHFGSEARSTAALNCPCLTIIHRYAGADRHCSLMIL